MAEAHKAGAEPNAQRVARWLVEHRAEFEEQGIHEDTLAPALDMSGEEITEAVDHLEAREEVVRMPQGMSSPPRFLLKPGRGWIDARDEILGSGNGT